VASPVTETAALLLLPAVCLCLQDEDVALFSIDGNHVGYENQLDLPNRINFDGSFLKFGPFKVSLAPLDGALAAVINVVNKTIVPGIEYLQYKSYNVVTSALLVRPAL
jgi:hypothetical protein